MRMHYVGNAWNDFEVQEYSCPKKIILSIWKVITSDPLVRLWSKGFAILSSKLILWNSNFEGSLPGLNLAKTWGFVMLF